MQKGRKIFYWVLTGIFLSMAVASMILTRDGDWQQFYDDGYVQDINEEWMRRAYYFGQYDSENKIYTWTEGCAFCYVGSFEWKEEIRYLQIDADGVSGEDAMWKIYYRDKEGNELAVQEIPFQNGNSIIPIEQIEKSYLLISLICTEDMQYQLHSMRLMEYTEHLKTTTLIAGALVCFALYATITGIWIVIRKRTQPHISRSRSTGIVVEKLALEVLDSFSTTHATAGYATWIRSLLILAIVLTWKVIRIAGYGWTVLITVVLLWTLAAWIPKEQESVKKNKYILAGWFGMCAVQFLSDMLLQKNYSEINFCEVWILLGFGVLYYAWGRMKEPEFLLEEFSRAMEIFCVANFLYCIFGDARRYIGRDMTGPTNNPNAFSIQLVVIHSVLLFRVYQAIKCKKRWYCFVFPSLGLAAGVWMLYEAKCRTAWIMFSGIVVVFGIFIMAYVMSRLHQKGRRRFVILLLMMIVLFGIGLILLGNYLFGTRDVLTLSVNSFFSGRPAIWKEFLGKINLLGHNEHLYMNGNLTYAHNEILALMYKYGIAVGIFAIIFWIEVVLATCQKCRKYMGNEYVLLTAMLMLAYVLPALEETMNEKPMTLINWFTVYFIIGYVIQEKNAGMIENDG